MYFFNFILFLIEIHASKRCIDPNQSAASDLGRHCLPMSPKMGR